MRAIRIHNRVLFGLLGAVLLATGLLNGVVDPLGIFRWVDRPGFNQVKPVEAEHRRLIKAYGIRSGRPHGLILGSSRAEAGLDPRHPAWPDDARPAYNAAFPDGNVYEMWRYLEHALALAEVRAVVIGLDFFAFNARFGNRPDFSEARLAVNTQGDHLPPPLDEPLGLLFSWDAVRKSVATLHGQDGKPFLKRDGQQAGRDDAPVAYHGYRGLFLLSEQEYLRYKWKPRPSREFVLRDPATGAGPMDDFARILQLARRHGVRLHLFLSPDHARLAEGVWQSGLWPLYEGWRRELVRALEEEGARAGAEPFALWDFNTYGPAMREPVPAWDDVASAMRWYGDASHYSTNTGNAILSTLFTGASDAPEVVGVRLDRATLEPHLASLRAGRAAYAEAHPEDVREIAEILANRPGDATSQKLSILFQVR